MIIKTSFVECPYCHKRSWVTDGEAKKVPYTRPDGQTVQIKIISYGCALQCTLKQNVHLNDDFNHA